MIDSAATNAEDVHAADVDGDGDSDLLSAVDGFVAWYENNGSGSFAKQFISASANDARSVFAADVNGDGDTDVIAASDYDQITLYTNSGGSDPTFTSDIVTASARDVRSVHAADIDGDGDIDVISASRDDDTIAWYENDGTASPSFTKRTLTASADGASSVYAADVNGDDTTEVLSASRFDDTVAWYEKTGGTTFTERTISTSANNVRSVHAADLDADGDPDVVSTDGDDLVWHENDGTGSPSFTRREVDYVDDPRDVFASDINGDGVIDLLSASDNDSKILLHKNNGAADPSFSEGTLARSVSRPRGVHAADVDGDGDVDPLSAARGDNEIAFYENGQVLDEVTYVDPDATGTENGTSWSDAYTNLQDALPDSSQGPVEIWVADGTYQPDEGEDVTSGDRSASFTIRTGTSIYGGFDGTDGQGGGARESLRSQRDPTPDSTGTVLSGDQGNEGFRGDDAFHVVTVDRGTVLLDGVVVRDGLASGSDPDNSGAGIWVRNGNLTVRNALIANNAASGNEGDGGGVRGAGTFENVIFRGNSANDTGGGVKGGGTFTDVTFRDNSADGYDGGGGIYVDRAASTFTNVNFRNNSASGGEGGGVSLNYRNATFVDVTFRDNSASRGGGGVYIQYAAALFEQVTFRGNSAYRGGGAYLDYSASATFGDASFRSNTAGGNGGGIYTDDDSELLSLKRVTVSGNTADRGGGVYADGTVRAFNVRFLGNEATRGNAGGVYIGNSGEPIANAVFSGNEADDNGGAIFIDIDSSPKIVNGSFTNNTAGQNGGSIYSTGSNSFPIIANSILWGNSATTGREIYVDSGQPSVGNSIVQGGLPGDAFDDGNVLDQDPLFANPGGPDSLPGTADDSLQLQSGSPAIDAGSNGELPADSLDLNGDDNTSEPIPLDIAGNARTQDVPNTGDDGNFVVDFGAYETEGELPNELANGDVDGSGSVSPNDASLTLRFFLGLISLSPAEQRAADFDGDGAILPFDASLILRDYLGAGSSSALAKARSGSEGSVRLGEMDVKDGTATIPVQLSGQATDVRSVALDLTFGSAVASIAEVAPAVPESWIASHSASEDGQLTIGLAGSSALEGGQTVAEIRLSLAESPGDLAPEGTFRLNGSDQRSLGSVLSATPSEFSLEENYPNPVRQATTIEYTLAESEPVRIAIYDMLGRRVETLVDTRQEAGNYSIEWRGRNASGGPVASGMYFYRIEAGDFTATEKMTVVR